MKGGGCRQNHRIARVDIHKWNIVQLGKHPGHRVITPLQPQANIWTRPGGQAQLRQ
jgi:hypothetical protein